ncbi:protein-glutamate O-methyltransferase CheR [Altererythrobacter xixiisoli]|uniref:Protein-glutamate O-methyltransferase CheR n=1 Tax=Croceibacterium xixiisoli TaxID=1476466 RepID=A0A6I4TVB3_9SPHN|nr:CheR family methyltransferase [Croceibacterium xixiisoli]MXO99159.1 protein-glutamate O-methyltransferase CheR [Croceibacterium xixiisoli]
MDAALIETFEPHEEIELDLLLEAIWRQYHYDFRGYSRSSLHRRMARAQARLGLPSLSHLQHRILRSPADFADLMGFLTIQVSEMFRDPSYFLALRQQVIPHLRTYPSLKVWIAGCANGEEFYSLAILFREEGLEDRTIFYCTDISPAALSKAEAGIYDLDRIAQFSENHRLSGGRTSLSDYYTAGYGAAVFDKSLRRRAVFAEHNLASDEVFSEVQLVSSRNVLIYFDRDLQDRALGLFGKSLVRGGFLGLGAKETLRFSACWPGFTDFAENEKIYRRNTLTMEEPRDGA